MAKGRGRLHKQREAESGRVSERAGFACMMLFQVPALLLSTVHECSVPARGRAPASALPADLGRRFRTTSTDETSRARRRPRHQSVMCWPYGAARFHPCVCADLGHRLSRWSCTCAHTRGAASAAPQTVNGQLATTDSTDGQRTHTTRARGMSSPAAKEMECDREEEICEPK